MSDAVLATPLATPPAVAAPQPVPALPPLFGRVEPLEPARHAALRLDRSAGLGFAARANAVPLSIVELPFAARHFPIVFASGPVPMPLAVLGYRAGENLFVGADGSWRAGTYLPAYLRAYPFIFLQPEGSEKLLLGIEPDAPALHTGAGEALFEGEQPSAFLKEMLRFCSDFRASLEETQRMAIALKGAGLLEEREARVEFRSGSSARLNGFAMLNPERFDALPDETILEWRRRHWLGGIYAILQASGSWSGVLDLAEAKAA
ncbi:SapC family protein [Roseomonas sp. GC11]|uniref:SapC family protein n=1 Tax=Roseomonas sp. GC11 TaxID=2950546 RepID=UPI00210C44C9|nr:SapC family protein [Roseomonas sp. GC11]MCQ4161574.1 SapC family protein [Roseomonas sp. GC11]